VNQEVQNDLSARWDDLLGEAEAAVHVAAGDVVSLVPDTGSVALVRAGVVRAFVRTAGGRQVTIRYARTGDLLGLEPLLGGAPPWDAEAVVHTTLTVLTLEQIQVAAARRPELSWLIAEHIATWACDTIQAMAHSSSQPMVSRVARHLCEINLPTADGRLVAHVSHQRLADAVGTVREVVSRQLRMLKAVGVIDTEPGRVVVLEGHRLEAIAAGHSLQ
jgi:CRP/FNR family transcriptional regulator